MDKRLLRKETIAKMKDYSIENKKSSDQYLMNQLLKHDKFIKANRIGLVLSMPHEVNTHPIIEKALAMNKAVFVPETDYDNKEMNFKRIESLDQIGPDDKGIDHVVSDTEISNDLDLVVVPGVVFNEEGYRIGYGGGYFDKFLSKHQPKTLSLIYEFQIDEIPVASHDQPVDELIVAKT
ncbi:5-formyltetrahydrofolate cyclo-ligase [Staphylococcus massiliensis]|uniref:5-formyltetrahydrofolate cyclo-ligase n=1 Tax=Staphylococcus massiliensis S46 TaxID=1229783 RepID=K9AV00_9STAP|nr:5-formyltetrahydrofolate cyclo-ligase [Staphylococcus massiliensis]EKU49881.1 5-formyltetrahydrofolate cyclo-ligase [Staphylococcus massiliensis S46]MCG3398985.1 5-formyltetrahydrofolate cyclo-ligase [Staphylococcus massiliensis]MCG3401016.1 5-formyltetrahydrofolate cyclo-ligase [Staphylococcus massiliensis]MCG3413034.1 5-formyltetrahydrofolate cyclo-ligase [Staphylococcus massiliensis]POA02026.1 5-formyltetrahydrofolate cyclo-ligase [Staphylococcus massiliensis CCUG 55927]